MGVKLVDLLLRLLSQHKMIVIHTCPKQGPPNNRVWFNRHFIHKLKSFKYHPCTTKKINHTPIMLKLWLNTIFTPHASEHLPTILQKTTVATSHQSTQKRNMVRL
ncbi:hypothetical protein Lal_00020824 [Lupinus albus]|nr:hypothetical protein Lal_00020824 [Lupinus albus]